MIGVAATQSPRSGPTPTAVDAIAPAPASTALSVLASVVANGSKGSSPLKNDKLEKSRVIVSSSSNKRKRGNTGDGDSEDENEEEDGENTEQSDPYPDDVDCNGNGNDDEDDEDGDVNIVDSEEENKTQQISGAGPRRGATARPPQKKLKGGTATAAIPISVPVRRGRGRPRKSEKNTPPAPPPAPRKRMTPEQRKTAMAYAAAHAYQLRRGNAVAAKEWCGSQGLDYEKVADMAYLKRKDFLTMANLHKYDTMKNEEQIRKWCDTQGMDFDVCRTIADEERRKGTAVTGAGAGATATGATAGAGAIAESIGAVTMPSLSPTLIQFELNLKERKKKIEEAKHENLRLKQLLDEHAEIDKEMDVVHKEHQMLLTRLAAQMNVTAAQFKSTAAFPSSALSSSSASSSSATSANNDTGMGLGLGLGLTSLLPMIPPIGTVQ